MLQRKTRTATPFISDSYRPITPLHTVSMLVWPRMVMCMIGRKLAGI